MSCPICGANCRCRKRGEGGICCSCHRHKASSKMTPAFRAKLSGYDGDALTARIRELHAAPAPDPDPELQFTNELLGKVIA